MRIIQFSAFGPVLCNLRNDFVCLIDHKFVADTQSQILIDGEVMHIGAATICLQHRHRSGGTHVDQQQRRKVAVRLTIPVLVTATSNPVHSVS